MLIDEIRSLRIELTSMVKRLEEIEEDLSEEAKNLLGSNQDIIPENFFSVRTENCFAHAGLTRWSDLCRKTEEELLRIKNFGKTGLKEVKKKLLDEGLSLTHQFAPERLADESSK
jgi:DNA-directed RNA polymerase subunit alpha